MYLRYGNVFFFLFWRDLAYFVIHNNKVQIWCAKSFYCIAYLDGKLINDTKWGNPISFFTILVVVEATMAIASTATIVVSSIFVQLLALKLFGFSPFVDLILQKAKSPWGPLNIQAIPGNSWPTKVLFFRGMRPKNRGYPYVRMSAIRLPTCLIGRLDITMCLRSDSADLYVRITKNT